jgi:hypothetical protein
MSDPDEDHSTYGAGVGFMEPIRANNVQLVHILERMTHSSLSRLDQ